MERFKSILPLLLAGALILASCKKEITYDMTYGSQVQVGNGSAQTFFTISSSGVPQELGVLFPPEALAGLPSSNTTYILDLPAKAIAVTPFKHVIVGLSAAGHGLPPTGHIEAHFDVRFFMTSSEERDAIPAPAAPLIPPAGAGFDAVPPAGYLPENYVMNYAVAKMGRHWAKDVFPAGTHVDHAMIYGTYNGELTFVAPIVTLAHLAAGSNHSVAYPQPQKFAKQGYYATSYHIGKDDKGKHFVKLSDFVSR